MPIQVGDVTATADSNGIELGDYAGKGILNGGSHFTYKAEDYGYLFVFGYFTVIPMNGYGIDRRVLRTQPLDFYNPEFDGLGADVISVGEYFSSPIIAAGDDGMCDSNVFGFTERYNSYRYGRDVLTGEMRDYSSDGDMNVWHTGRLLTTARAGSELVAQSSTVNTLSQTDSQYDRIFSLESGPENKFYLTAQFGVTAIRPMLNLNQVVRLGEGSTVVPRNGNVVN